MYGSSSNLCICICTYVHMFINVCIHVQHHYSDQIAHHKMLCLWLCLCTSNSWLAHGRLDLARFRPLIHLQNQGPDRLLSMVFSRALRMSKVKLEVGYKWLQWVLQVQRHQHTDIHRRQTWRLEAWKPTVCIQNSKTSIRLRWEAVSVHSWDSLLFSLQEVPEIESVHKRQNKNKKNKTHSQQPTANSYQQHPQTTTPTAATTTSSSSSNISNSGNSNSSNVGLHDLQLVE